jgi:hypothetical protein
MKAASQRLMNTLAEGASLTRVDDGEGAPLYYLELSGKRSSAHHCTIEVLLAAGVLRAGQAQRDGFDVVRTEYQLNTGDQ